MAETQFGIGDVIAERFEVSEILGIYASHVVYPTVATESGQTLLIEETLGPGADSLVGYFE